MSIADVRRNGGSIFVMNSALDLIGNTPMVDVSNLSPNPNVRLVAKLESQNPYGSVKDRIAKAMIEDAERTGRLVPGQRIVEPVGAFAAGHALDRHLHLAVGLGRARQRVAAIEMTVGVGDLEGQELAGAVAVPVGQLGGDIENVRPGIRRFPDDLGDLQRAVGHPVNPRSLNLSFEVGLSTRLW